MILVCLVSFNDPCQLDREYVSDVYSIVDSHSHAAARGARCEQLIRSDHVQTLKQRLQLFDNGLQLFLFIFFNTFIN